MERMTRQGAHPWGLVKKEVRGTGYRRKIKSGGDSESFQCVLPSKMAKPCPPSPAKWEPFSPMCLKNTSLFPCSGGSSLQEVCVTLQAHGCFLRSIQVWGVTEGKKVRLSTASPRHSPPPRLNHAHKTEVSLSSVFCTGGISLPAIFPGHTSSTHRHQLLSISGLRHGCKDFLSHQASPCFSPTSPTLCPRPTHGQSLLLRATDTSEESLGFLGLPHAS